MRVLAVGAHPDDLEILCAGTLVRYVEDGHEVVMAHATDGGRGAGAGTDPVELAEVRVREARAAAEIGGASHVCVGIPDGSVNAGDVEQRQAIVDLVRAAAPDLVLTHHPDDYHGDHRELSRLVFAASFAAANPMMPGPGPTPSAVPALYYLDTLAGLGGQPTEYVDITDQMDAKRAMLGAHRSQLTYLLETFGADVMDQIEVCSRYRGLQAGVRYAEAFFPCPTWHRVRTTRLLP